LKRLTLKMLWILRTPLMRRTALMVLVLGVLLSDGALAPASAAKSNRSTHKSSKSAAKPGKAAHSAPVAAAANAASPASRHGASLRTSKSRAANSAMPLRTRTRLSATHEKSHSLALDRSRSRTTSASSEGSGTVKPLSVRHRAQARTAVLGSRSHLRMSRRHRERELALSPAPAIEEVSLHRGDLGLPAPLRGSLASLERQNVKSEDEDGLERIQDEDDLQDRIAHNFLVPVPTSADLGINQDLPETHRYCRPWTAQFLADLAREHATRFQHPLEVSSAVRTVAYQKKLERINGNAAAAEGDIASPHLTGATIDIAKTGMTRDEISWMRTSLLALENAGKLDVEEEFRQRCFHITVYKSYTGATPTLAPPAEAADSAETPALPESDSAAQVDGSARVPASRQGTKRTRAKVRRSRHAVSRRSRALPA